MQQKRMTQQQMTVRQMAQPQFTRQHGMHEHSMSIAQPQRDSRRMVIPSGTFEELGGAKLGALPFRGLRTWLFSLLALIALPLGAMLMYVGNAMQSEASWEEQTAQVEDYSEDGVRYSLEGNRRNSAEGFFNFRPENFLSSSGDSFSLSLSVCDLLSRFIINEETEEFTVWQHPDEPERLSCFPVTGENGTMLLILGFILAGLSALGLLRTISGAAGAKQASFR